MSQLTNECNIDKEKKKIWINKERGRDLLLLPSFEIEIIVQVQKNKDVWKSEKHHVELC